MSVEKQIRRIARDELEVQSENIEEVLRSSFREENLEIKERLETIISQLEEMGIQISKLRSRTETLEEELNNKLRLIVKLRINTLDKLISEYQRLMGILFPNQEESNTSAS